MNAQVEIESGDRFTFGANWASFLNTLDDDRISAAEGSLREWLGVTDLKGLRFVDVGCGSGLFSLAARRLGARVHSFDFDPQSVGCARVLRDRYFRGDTDWMIDEGSVLDTAFIQSMGTFDVVYSWGVLHHTGAMWQAMANVTALVAEGGKLFIAIYNDVGIASQRWTTVKRIYCKSPSPVQGVMLVTAGAYFLGKRILRRAFNFENPLVLPDFAARKKTRGMTVFHDLKDWVGGYPYEVAKPEGVFDFYKARGFALDRLMTCGAKHACNQFVFRRLASEATSVTDASAFQTVAPFEFGRDGKQPSRR